MLQTWWKTDASSRNNAIIVSAACTGMAKKYIKRVQYRNPSLFSYIWIFHSPFYVLDIGWTCFKPCAECIRHQEITWLLVWAACISMDKKHVNGPPNKNASLFCHVWRLHSPCIIYRKVIHASNLAQNRFDVMKQRDYRVCGMHFQGQKHVKQV